MVARMIRFELKKLYCNSVVLGSMAVLLLISLFILQACCLNNSATSLITPDGVQLSGREAIEYNQSIASQYTGDFTDETIAKMVADFSERYPDQYEKMVRGDSISLTLPSAYIYLSMFIPPENYDEIAQDALEHGTTIPPLTEDGLVGLRDYGTVYVDKPLQYGYSDSWAFLFTGFCGPTIAVAFPALIVIVIAISTVFSSEYSTKMAALILTSRYGKNRQIFAKLIASIIFTTVLIICLFLLFCIAFGIQYGPVGWNADMQTNLGLSLLGVALPFNNLQLLLFGLGIVWIAGVFTTAATAMISSLTRSPFSSLIIAFTLFMAPWIIRQMLPEGFLHDALLIFPANSVNVQEVLISPINAQSVFYLQPWGPALCILGAVIVSLLLSVVIMYRAFSNHQAAG